jgi:hypothetical protein
VGEVVVIDAASAVRLGLVAEDQIAGSRLQARAYGVTSRIDSVYYASALMDQVTRREELRASSVGGGLLHNRPLLAARLQWVSSLGIDSEEGEAENRNGAAIGGRATIAAAASGFKYERGVLRADGAAGVAVPLDLDGAAPWPEGKITVRYTPTPLLTVRTVAGHKGRLPTLRERYELGTGNEALGPEKALYVEAGAELKNNDLLRLDLAGYLRRANGMIRFVPELERLGNSGELTVRGVDARATVFPYAAVQAGGSLSLLAASSAELGDEPIDRLPERRADLWLSGRWRTRAGGMLRLRYTGEQRDQQEILPDHTLLEASSYLRFTTALMATLRVDNLLDHRYLDRRGGVMGPGRVVMFGLQGLWE